MNKKILFAVIAIVVVIILIVAVFEIVVLPKPVASMTVSVNSSITTAGTNLTFAAFISGGTPSRVIFNFGDGYTGKATHLLGNEYTVMHSYSSPGKYLVTANATVNGEYVNNLKSIFEVSVMPATVSPTVASEITIPSVILPMQIVSPGSTLSITASTLEPPTATNWSVGYYILNFGDGTTHTNYTIFNTSSSSFMACSTSHLYSTQGIYALTLGVITFNATGYVPSTYTINGINYTYYPVSDLASILSSGKYHNTTYMTTIVVNSTAQLLKSTVPGTNPNEIIVTEVFAGGPYSFDPAIDYESVGMEIIANVYETLVAYNGSSTTQLFPMIASEIPTVANGGISSNYLNYTFQIRGGLKFSNGDPLTAWDAYTSYIRTLLFVVGSPGTNGWILAQDLLPYGGFVAGAESYENITSAVTVNNASQSVTFHLLKPDPAFLDYIADPQGAAIMDYNWLVAHGAGITFTPAGFAAYMNQSNEPNYNNYVRYNTMGSGPYVIKNYLIGQSISFAPSPYYTPLQGVPGYNHTANDTIYIQYEKDTSTGLLLAETGQTDIIINLPPVDYPILAKLQSEGKLNITAFPTFTIYWFQFNFDINESMLSELGSGYSVPQYYFTNVDVRRAFAYAFDYTNFINNIIGNAKYGATFAFHYTGIIPKGMIGYMNVSQLQQAGAVVPVYNLTIAKQYLEESGLYNTSINIPIIVWTGDSELFAGAEDWAATLNSIDPNIHATALYMEFEEEIGYMIPGENPMPIYIYGWTPDYPFPSDYVVSMYQEYGYCPYGSSWNPETLTLAGQANQSNEDTLMNQYIAEAQSTENVTTAVKYYDMAEVIGVNLTFYTYLDQINEAWFYSPSLHGAQYELNPIFGGSFDTIYIYLSK